MGNSLEKYHFETPVFGSFNLSSREVYVVDNEEKASVAVENYLKGCPILYVDCEGHYFGNPQQGSLSVVQVATSPQCCFIFDVFQSPEILLPLKRLFESANIKKVFHDCSGDASILFYKGGIILKNVDDTQIAQKIIEYNSSSVLDRSTGWSLEELYARYTNKVLPCRGKIRGEVPGENIWFQRPLPEKLVKYAAVDSFILTEIFPIQWRALNSMGQLSNLHKTLVNKQLSRKIEDPSVYLDVEDHTRADDSTCTIS